MTKRALFAAGAALLAMLAGSVALAGEGDYMCETFSPAKNAPPQTHCVTWTRQAAARMGAVHCDPQTMSGTTMRATCADLMAHPQQPAPPADKG